MSESQPTHYDAEIILKLYDLRREPVMREARAFFVQFSLKSLDDIVKVANEQQTAGLSTPGSRIMADWQPHL